jgi:hypothetical protein
MVAHMERHLGKEERRMCPQCGEHFDNSTLKKEHIRDVHEGKKTAALSPLWVET